ncbi:MAG: leucyl/phenylalanyl-tRNA--protein transferase [Treponema sp.]|nr:leucyl/phenylalanyl-tRNA--protein transferase [Treponema sp.]
MFDLNVLYQRLTGISECPIFVIPEQAQKGLLGYTDDLTVPLVCAAYLQGVFPWYEESDGEPVLWWSPDPRFVLPVQDLHVPKSLEKFIKKTPFTYTIDVDFPSVIQHCADMDRPGQQGTWIGKNMIDLYCQLAQMHIAHSVEVWHDGILVGGLYGVLIGQVFFGESMFTVASNSAKSAFVLFAKAFALSGGKLIDSQVYTDNLARFGAHNISRTAFLRLEHDYLPQPSVSIEAIRHAMDTLLIVHKEE